MRGADLGLTVAAQLALAEVIGHNQNDVRAILSRASRRRQGKKSGTGQADAQEQIGGGGRHAYQGMGAPE